jgi:hypothetical protein
MGFTGGCTTQASGATADIIEDVRVLPIGTVDVVEATVWKPYRNRFLAPFIGGIYAGKNEFAGVDGLVRVSIPRGGTLYLEDAGRWPAFDPGREPSGRALKFESLNSRRLRIHWLSRYRLGVPQGDAQLSAIVITGAVRGVNCVREALTPTRGKLSYTIKSDGGDYTVQWWNGIELVAEGTRTGNGAVPFEAMNGSGLIIAGTLTYTADVPPATAFVEIRWPKEYQIHFAVPAHVIDDDTGGTVIDDDTGGVVIDE